MSSRMSTGPSELVLAEVPVVSRLAIGSERLRLFFTEGRILVAHIGKRGTAAMATTSLFGQLSGAVEDLLKRGRESASKRGKGLRPAEILKGDKDNFAFGYDEVVSVQLVKAEYTSLITIVTVQEKLEFSTPLGFEKLVEIFSRPLSGKLSVNRLGHVRP